MAYGEGCLSPPDKFSQFEPMIKHNIDIHTV